MRFSFSTILATTLCFATMAVAQAVDAPVPGLGALQGAWAVSAAEQRGKSFDAIKGGVLKISGDSFELTTAAGNRIDGKLRVNNEASPKQIDFLLTGGATWLGIYSLSNAIFRLNYVEMADGAERPTVFATTSETVGTVIVMRRTDPL